MPAKTIRVSSAAAGRKAFMDAPRNWRAGMRKRPVAGGQPPKIPPADGVQSRLERVGRVIVLEPELRGRRRRRAAGGAFGEGFGQLPAVQGERVLAAVAEQYLPGAAILLPSRQGVQMYTAQPGIRH